MPQWEQVASEWRHRLVNAWRRRWQCMGTPRLGRLVRVWVFVAAVAVVGLSFDSTLAEDLSPRVLVRSAPAGDEPWLDVERLARTAGVMRSRPVRIDAATLDALVTGDASAVRLPLFADANAVFKVVRRQRPRDGALLWTGRLENVEYSMVSLVLRDGLLTASIHGGPFGNYDIVSRADGAHFVRELDGSGGDGRCGWDARAAADGSNGPFTSRPHDGVQGTWRPAGTAGVGFGCDDGSVVDLMVVYTPDARVSAGGVPQIESLIDVAVADANQAFADSGIGVSINLVHTQEVSYTETGSWEVDGPRLVATDDGHIDQVHPLRDEYGADCVSLWVATLNSGGIGYFPDGSLSGVGFSGFSMVRLDNATLLTPVHELGHNFFCDHDRPNSTGIPYAEYSYGYTRPDNAWRTIMSVAAPPMIPRFANPDLCWPTACPGGDPTGVPVGQPLPSDVALTIEQTRHFVANFRATRFVSAGPALRVAHDASGGGDGSSWATAFDNIERAVCAAAGSAGTVTEIWVKAGTYTPDGGGDRSSTFRLLDGVTFYGGFDGSEASLEQRDVEANVTVLSGDIGAAGVAGDNCYHVVTVGAEQSDAALDGFTITGGNADGGAGDDGGGGALVEAGGTAIFRQCTFAGSSGATFGGAVYVRSGGSPTIAACRFSGNTVGGTNWPAGGAAIFHEDNGASVIEGCVFSGNSGRFGSAICNLFGSSPTIRDCLFENHVGPADAEGGAIYNYSFCNPVIERCIFKENSAGYGGAVCSLFSSAVTLTGCRLLANSAMLEGGGIYNYSECNAMVVNCAFSGNTANFGAAMINLFDSQSMVINCTLVGNAAAVGGGGIYNHVCDPTIANALLWDNSAGALADEAAQISGWDSVATLSHCSVQGWTGGLGGTNNDGLDPLFRDANGADDTYGTTDDDLQLGTTSPAINGGDNAALPGAVTTDIDGQARIIALTVDRGAHEFSGAGDADGDGDVDLADHAAMVECLEGPGALPAPMPPATTESCLLSFDFDGDGDVDLDDAGMMQTAFGTAG